MAGPRRVTEEQLAAPPRSPRQPLQRSTSTSPASSYPTIKAEGGQFAKQTHFPEPLDQNSYSLLRRNMPVVLPI